MKRVISLLGIFVFLSFACLTGAWFSYNKPVLNMDEKVIYKRTELRKLNTDSDSLKDFWKLNGKDVFLWGKVKTADAGNNLIVIEDKYGNELMLNTKAIEQSIKLNVDDNIRVYGSSYTDKGKGAVRADKIEKSDLAPDKDFYFADGSGYSKGEAARITLNTNKGGEIGLYVPPEWLSVENNEALNIPEDSGHCFYINALNNDKTAECFICFYFDEFFLKYNSDSQKTREIEKAIIRNISKKDKLNFIEGLVFPSLTTKLENGRSYDYYVTEPYDNHKIEFVFTKLDEGMVVFMYIYDDYNNDLVQDIIFTMTSFEVDKEE